MKKLLELDVVELTLALCQIDSTTGKEAQVIDYVEELCVQRGFQTKRQKVGEERGRDNLLVFSKNKKPEILLTTHLDTVPPYFPPSLSKNKKRLKGRGVCDAKGIAAAMLCAACELKKEGVENIGLLFLVGEETSSDGAKTASINFAPKVSFMVNGEPTDLKLVEAMKGAIVFELKAKGQAGHSAYPESGHSALHQLNDDIYRILHHKWPVDKKLGPTTVNIGCFESGVAANVIADKAWAKGIMRTTKNAQELVKKIESLISKDTQLKILSASSPLDLHTMKGFKKCVVSFGCDIPHLKGLGIPLMIGPGSIFEAHTQNESIEVSQIKDAVQIYKQLVKKLTKAKK